MRALTILFAGWALTACSIIENGVPDYSVTVTHVQNERAGTRVFFVVEDDGEPVTLAGAAFGRDSLFNITTNQALADSLNSDTLSVLLPGADDGSHYFQAFATFEDGFYAVSESVRFQVTSVGPTPTCNPSDNVVNFAGARCGPTGMSISAEQDGDKFQVKATCSTRNIVTLTFPRNPTSGVYRTVPVIDWPGSRDKQVVLTVQEGFFFSYAYAHQDVFVNRNGDQTVITLCGATYKFSMGSQRELSGRLVFDN